MVAKKRGVTCLEVQGAAPAAAAAALCFGGQPRRPDSEVGGGREELRAQGRLHGARRSASDALGQLARVKRMRMLV